MKAKAKANIVILLTLGVFFTLLPTITNNFRYIIDTSSINSGYSNDITLDYKNLQFSAVSGKIHIDNNWTESKTAGIVTGNGTYTEPYLIEDLEIDSGGSGNGILIENSKAYFSVENCIVYNAGSELYNAAIKLQNVSNGLLINNDASNNYYNVGILLYLSNNNTVSGNILSQNLYGIYLRYGANNTISGNTVEYNSRAIYLSDTNNNTISENTVDRASAGIYINSGSRGNTIYLNCFFFNISDNGWNNHWDNGIKGNYYSDYIGLDENGDGIGDVPYNISGFAGSQDNFPLMRCPISQRKNVNIIPGYNLFFLLGIITIVTIIIRRKLSLN